MLLGDVEDRHAPDLNLAAPYQLDADVPGNAPSDQKRRMTSDMSTIWH